MNEGMPTCGSPSEATYRYRGCRCDACRAAKNAYEKRRRLDSSRGVSRLVDAGEVRDLLARLSAVGITTAEVARASGVGLMTLRDAVSGRTKSVRRSTLEAIESAGRDLRPWTEVDAAPAALMVTRWVGAGLTRRRVSEVSGLSYAEVTAICNGERTRVRAATLAKLLAAKDELDAECPRDPWEGAASPRRARRMDAVRRRVYENRGASGWDREQALVESGLSRGYARKLGAREP